MKFLTMFRRTVGLVFLAGILVSCSSSPQGLERVVKVFDGDTVLLADGTKVRLIGIDCPESHDSDKLQRIIRKTGLSAAQIKAQGRQAEEFTRGLTLNKDVLLEFDEEYKDKYGRTLAYVWIYLRDEVVNTITPPEYYVLKAKSGYSGQFIFLNATIMKAGYAETLSIPPNTRYARQFRQYLDEAREKGRGLWAAIDPSL